MASQEAHDIRTREAAVAAGCFGRARGPPVSFGDRCDEGPLQCTGASLSGICHTDFRLGAPGGTARSGPHHRRRRGFSEGYVSGQQTCLLGAGGRETRVLQAGGPPRPVSSPPSVGGHLVERHHGGGGGLPVPQVCREESHGGPGDSHPGGVCPDEDPDPPGGGLGFAVPEEQGVRRHPAHAQARCRPFRLQVHVQGMRNGVARGGQALGHL